MAKNEIIIDQQFKDYNPVIFGYERCKPSHSYGPAVRTHWLLHYVTSGKGIFRREGVKYELKKGEIFVIPPFLETYYEADREDPWSYIWIGFTTDGMLAEQLLSPVIACPEAGMIFEEMKSCKNMEYGRSAFLSSKLWELTAILLEGAHKEPDYIEKALNCMRSEYMTPIGVADIAARLNLDRSYFSGLFHQRIGVPPGVYLRTLRMEKASELMLHHNMSSTTAGLSVGYPDPYHFSKAFKKHFGLSPREFKIKNSKA